MPSLRDPDTLRDGFVDAADGQTVMTPPVPTVRTDCLEVWLNGIQQNLGVGWTRSGQDVVFTEPLVGTDIVRFVWSDP